MLQNAYFLAKIGADTAENEQHFAEILPKTGKICFAYPGARLHLSAAPCARWRQGGLGLAILGKLANFCKFLAGSFSAVSKRNFARKYAFDSIFQALQDLHPFAPLQSQNFRKKSVWKISNFCENSVTFLQMSQNLQKFAEFQKFQLDNLVDFEKCCKTHIFLQKSVPIQPKTNNILPKFCQKLARSVLPTLVPVFTWALLLAPDDGRGG